MRTFYFYALALFAGCSIGQPNQIAEDKMTTSVYYEMSPNHQSKFLEAIKGIKIGDSHDEVCKRLGSPFDETIIRGNKIDDPVRGLSVRYYTKKLSKDIVNEKQDKYISISFDNQNKVTDILTNIEGLSNKLAYSTKNIRIWRLPDNSPLLK